MARGQIMKSLSYHARSRPEPLVLIDGSDTRPDGPTLNTVDVDVSPVDTDRMAPAHSHRQGRRVRRRLLHLVEVAAVLALVAIVVVPGVAGWHVPAPAVEATTPTPSRLVIARTDPGELVAMLPYKQVDLCGQLEVLLDGDTVDPRILVEVESHEPAWRGAIVAFDVPATVGPGPHELQLVSGLPGLTDGLMCAGHYQGPVATQTILVAPSNTPPTS